MDDTNQVEHEQISTSLEVEQIEVNLFRSKSLWLPLRSRGVFGGQVISQALVSATNSVEPAFALHSLHCYFLTSASPSTPIVYYVERLRQGRSYCTRSVKAVQNGEIIFIMLCSFQKPEPWQPSHQWPMPEVPAPDDCELDEMKYAREIQDKRVDPKLVMLYQALVAERSRSPIAIKPVAEHIVTPDGIITYMYWMKARSIPPYDPSFQKCILAYFSDHYFISTAARIMGLRRGGKGKDALAMTSTLDHTIWFYNNDFDTGDWMLYVMQSPRSGSGKGIVHGRIYTRAGALVAVTSQEGVMRADVRGPEEGNTFKTKL